MSELWKNFRHTGVIKTSQPAREDTAMKLTGKLKEQVEKASILAEKHSR